MVDGVRPERTRREIRYATLFHALAVGQTLPLALFRGATLQGFLPLDGNRHLGAECSVQDRRLVIVVFLQRSRSRVVHDRTPGHGGGSAVLPGDDGYRRIAGHSGSLNSCLRPTKRHRTNAVLPTHASTRTATNPDTVEIPDALNRMANCEPSTRETPVPKDLTDRCRDLFDGIELNWAQPCALLGSAVSDLGNQLGEGRSQNDLYFMGSHWRLTAIPPRETRRGEEVRSICNGDPKKEEMGSKCGVAAEDRRSNKRRIAAATTEKKKRKGESEDEEGADRDGDGDEGEGEEKREKRKRKRREEKELKRKNDPSSAGQQRRKTHYCQALTSCDSFPMPRTQKKSSTGGLFAGQ